MPRAHGEGLQKYSLGDEIGRGASGTVYKALHLVTGGMVAIKKVALRGESKDDVDAVIEKAMSIDDAPVVIDFVVGHDAQVWPMVAAGASNDDILAARDVRPVFGDQQV